ncbi:MAG TPA: DNA mismatch repair endonuclease MutL [Thermomicrobiaceae bacterium]|nr:DNA mismatch repair endonuclease MutL [Thermomicrobiaceae bacterium]
MPIQLLDDATIGKIAAGEVVERPASVVKELVENALDAGARRLRVELEQGGKALIRVSDDGAGMRPAELPLALARHATSKLRAFSDLDRLACYGFRGEALASIAAVSVLEIVSRAADHDHAARLRAHFGRVEPAGAVPAAPGTTITVRDLFANVPARAAFLRADVTEAGYAQRAVAACALAHPEVRVELLSDGKPVFRTDGSGRLANAAVGVLGAEVAARLIPIAGESEDQGVRVGGLIGLPSLTRGNRQQLILLVNRRWIEHKSLAFALEQAYHTLIMVGRYPVAVINLELPPDRVDVNVHPTKREVRFREERLVFATLQRAARAALMAHTPVQSVPSVVVSPLSAAGVQRRLTLADPERAGRPAPRTPARAAPAPAAASSAAPPLRVLGQVGGTYIIAEGPNGLYLIDQHAAHERVLLEELLTRLARQTPEAQRLLEPLVVELNPGQLAVFEGLRAELTHLGFELEGFGGSALAIRAVPAIMRRREPRETLLAILDEAAQGGDGLSRVEALAMTTACHSAIRAGQTLSLAEMRELVLQLEGCTAPRACAHGRPTMLHLSQTELERQFERR